MGLPEYNYSMKHPPSPFLIRIMAVALVSQIHVRMTLFLTLGTHRPKAYDRYPVALIALHAHYMSLGVFDELRTLSPNLQP